jgi:ABC-type transport system involved in cytochrome c biogenesis ATPase subunit
LAVGQNSPAGPPLWLLDEPAAGLDPGAIAMLTNSILAHLANEGVAVIASHGGHLDEALGGHADRLSLMDTAR